MAVLKDLHIAHFGFAIAQDCHNFVSTGILHFEPVEAVFLRT